MRYAIISDVHANWQAWSAVLADIHANQADAIICLGDVVGYGPRPEEVLTSVRQATRNFVIGNHDAAACGMLDASIFNDHARSVVHWTGNQLSAESRAFLQQVPLTLETEDILFVHAEIQHPDRFGYIENEDEAVHQFMYSQANIIFFGHTHKPLAYSLNSDGIKKLPDSDFHLAPGHRYLVNVGSAGEPRDPKDIRARYVLYDSTRRAVYFRKVKFDVEAYRQDLQQVGLNIQPYFLSVIDHEASQGRNPIEALSDHMMSVPEKPLFTGNKTAAQKIILGDSPAPTHVPAPTPPAPGQKLMNSLPPPPVTEKSIPITNPPRQITTSASTVPKPAQNQSNFGFVVFILGVILAALTISLLILFA
ncbi:MAG: metallophosphoesterase family protein [Verrucomicrobiales bacterium]|nr:metallophosphoesterase family protein [Verrucomicrobiales bacterium]